MVGINSTKIFCIKPIMGVSPAAKLCLTVSTKSYNPKFSLDITAVNNNTGVKQSGCLFCIDNSPFKKIPYEEQKVCLNVTIKDTMDSSSMAKEHKNVMDIVIAVKKIETIQEQAQYDYKWQLHEPVVIPVTVVENIKVESCICTNDPHCYRTFAGRTKRFEPYRKCRIDNKRDKKPTFVMYRHEYEPFEVQAELSRDCIGVDSSDYELSNNKWVRITNYNDYYCINRVAIRVRNNVIIVKWNKDIDESIRILYDSASEKHLVTDPKCTLSLHKCPRMPRGVQIQRKKDNTIVISIEKIKLRVKLTLKTRWINLEMHMPVAKNSKAEGVCHAKQESNHDELCEFLDQYLIDHKKSFFHEKGPCLKNIVQSTSIEENVCNCKQTDNEKKLNCNEDSIPSDSTQVAINKMKLRFLINQCSDEKSHSDDIVFKPDDNLKMRKAQERATEICRERLEKELGSIEEVFPEENLHSQIVDACIVDVEAALLNDLNPDDFIDATKETTLDLVTTMIQTDPKFYEPMPKFNNSYEEPEFHTPVLRPEFSAFINRMCPMDCNSNGDCRDGVCICRPPFKGAYCHWDSNIPPNITLEDNDVLNNAALQEFYGNSSFINIGLKSSAQFYDGDVFSCMAYSNETTVFFDSKFMSNDLINCNFSRWYLEDIIEKNLCRFEISLYKDDTVMSNRVEVKTCNTRETTTLQPTTTEKTTPQPTTAEETTLQSIITEETTLQPITTEGTTPKPTTTEETTPKPITTEETTTLQPITTETTTLQPIKTEETTLQSITIEEMTLQPITTEKTTLQPIPTEKTTLLPTTTETTTLQPITTEETTPKPTTTEKTTLQPITTETTTPQPTTTEETALQPTTTEENTLQLTTTKETTLQPTTTEETTLQPIKIEERTQQPIKIEETPLLVRNNGTKKIILTAVSNMVKMFVSIRTIIIFCKDLPIVATVTLFIAVVSIIVISSIVLILYLISKQQMARGKKETNGVEEEEEYIAERPRIAIVATKYVEEYD